MRSKHCITLWLIFGSCAALILPAPRRPVRTRHHAAPPLEFVKAVGAHLPLADDATCSYVHRDPDVLVLRDFIKKEDCDGLLKAGRAASLEKSPVEYAGWTEDAAELLQTWASGPAAWIALLPLCLFR